MTETRLLVGFISIIAVGVSFALTVLFFGPVVLTATFLVVAGLALLAVPGRRQTAVAVLVGGGVTVSGPLIYVGLALLKWV